MRLATKEAPGPMQPQPTVWLHLVAFSLVPVIFSVPLTIPVNTTHGYLLSKDNPKSSYYVTHIAYSFEDPLFSNWFQTSQTFYKSLSFPEFMVKVHSHWLTTGWEKDLALKVQNSKQGSTFCNFSTAIHHDNVELAPTVHNGR